MKRLLIPIFAFVVGGMLLVLGVPRTIAAFIAIPGSVVLDKIQELDVVTVEELQMLIATQHRELVWNNSGRLQTDMGLSQILLAEKYGQNDSRRIEAIGKAIKSLKVGLSKAPANPFAWTRLAYALALKDGVSAQSIAALILGTELAPFEPRLAFARISFGFAAWRHLQPSERELIFRQVRDLWNTWPHNKDLVKYAVKSGQVNFIRAALIPNPSELAKFESLFQRASR